MSDLKKLFEHYRAPHKPAGASLSRQTVKVGIVRYRKCVNVISGTGGLFLWVRPPLGREKQLLIPWDQIKQFSDTRLYGLQGVCMSIGDPQVGAITVYRDLFDDVIRAFLSPQ